MAHFIRFAFSESGRYECGQLDGAAHVAVPSDESSPISLGDAQPLPCYPFAGWPYRSGAARVGGITLAECRIAQPAHCKVGILHETSRGISMVTLRILIAAVLILAPVSLLRADRIILRNLDIISDKTVDRFDEDGVRLDDGTVISWDRIEKGRVAESKQEAFDAMLADLGSDLYRIRQRMSISDYRGLLPHAETLFSRYKARPSDTAYMVFQALMWSRLAIGQREAALEPYHECVEC